MKLIKYFKSTGKRNLGKTKVFGSVMEDLVPVVSLLSPPVNDSSVVAKATVSGQSFSFGHRLHVI